MKGPIPTQPPRRRQQISLAPSSPRTSPSDLVTHPQKTGNINFLSLHEETIYWSNCERLIGLVLLKLLLQFTSAPSPLDVLQPVFGSAGAVLGALTFSEFTSRDDIYNILWALVFGFATLNILSLVSRRFDPKRHRMSFGEMMALGTVLVAVILLGWEMLYLFHVFPIRLSSN